MNRFLFSAVVLSLAMATPALAYIGPGAGLGAIGTVLAVLGSILLLIVGFVWYPIKRLIRKFRKPQAEEKTDTP